MSFEGAAISLGATVISAAFASLVFAQWIGRRKSYQLAWSLGLGLYAVAGIALPDNVRAFSYLFTIPGSVALIGIAAYSYWRSRLVFNLWIGIGALITAIGGSLARYNIPWALYIGVLVGIAVMFEGFLRSQDVAKAPRPAPAQTAS